MKNPRLDQLDTYAFWRLQTLLENEKPPREMEPIALHVGEPKVPPPAFVAETVAEQQATWGRYPPHNGTPSYRKAAGDWLTRRYNLPDGMIDAERNVLPVAGSKEGLFHMALLAVPGGDTWKRNSKPAALTPNPVYPVYNGAAVFAGAEQVSVSATAETGFMPDYAALDPELLERTALVYLCNPANPQGAIADADYLMTLVKLARKHDFVLVFDECYSEIYRGDPPTGGLEACARLGGDMRNVMVLHSLSKRSSAPGIRCGAVSGDAELIGAYKAIRSYAGVSIPLPLQKAGERLWRDETHVDEIREHYAALFDMAERILGDMPGFANPPGGFFLWLDVGDGEATALRLWREAGVRVMPGGYMARPDFRTGENPGDRYIRVALVHELDFAEDALTRMAKVLNG